MMINQSTVKDLLNYDQSTGEFSWKKSSKGTRAGDVAGYRSVGYVRIGISNKEYMAHKLAWLYVYGVMPSLHLDHINGVRHDNRIENLREATVSQNLSNRGANANNKSGLKGVTWIERLKKWRATCVVNGKPRSILIHTAKVYLSQSRCFTRQNRGEVA